MHALRGGGPLEAARMAWLRKRLRFGKELLSDVDVFYKRQMAISIICEDLPEAKNRIYLDHNVADQYGVSGVKVEYKLHENTKAVMLAGMANARKIMITAGSKKTFAYGPVRDTGWHTMGTCRMGSDPKTSVVNKFGEVHGVSNLYITDSSVFTSGSCVNPANTVQAVALYLANNIVKQFKAA